MTFLAALLPGVRQVRTPLATGAIWLVFFYLLATANRDWLADNAAGVLTLFQSATQIAGLYLIGVLAFISYLTGVVTLEPSRWISAAILGGYVRLRSTVLQPRSRFSFRGILSEAMKKRFASAGIDPAIVLVFPIEKIVESLETTSFQLWHQAPDQYQEHDRLESEIQFREALWAPLVAVGVTLWIATAWWVGLVLVLAALMLLIQVPRIEHERRTLLVAAFSEGLIDVPIASGTMRELGGVKLSRKESMGPRAAALAIAFDRIGEWDASDGALWAAVDDISENVDFSRRDWVEHVDHASGHINRVFNKNGASTVEEQFNIYVAFAKETVSSLCDGSGDERVDRSVRGVWREIRVAHLTRGLERLRALSDSIRDEPPHSTSAPKTDVE